MHIYFSQIESMPNLKDNKRSQKYVKNNGFSRPLPILQILAIILVLVIFVLGTSLIPSIIQLESPILNLFMGFGNYFILAIIVDSLLIMLGDPADPRLIDEDYYIKGQKLQFCKDCQVQVDILSYHCKVCRRCVEQFDHHCIFLNNCIGKKNYKQFFRLLLSLLTYTGINIGLGVWLVVNLQSLFRWIALAYSILSLIVFVEISSLTVFHCYISCFSYKTTLQVIRGDKKKSIQVLYPKKEIFSARMYQSNLGNGPSKLELNQKGFAFGPGTQHPFSFQQN